MTKQLPAIEIEPHQGKADAAVIWLHGLGADGHDFEGVIPELGLPANHGIRFILPHAPAIPVTLNNGMVMPAWFDILDLNNGKLNVRQLLASAAAVHSLIDREMERGVASERILLIGFSQGGAVNYQAALTYDKPLGGMLAMSSYFPTGDVIEVHPANSSIPIQIFHGLHDTVLPVLLAQRSKARLEALGLHPEYKIYPIDHEVAAEEIRDTAAWIRRILYP